MPFVKPAMTHRGDNSIQSEVYKAKVNYNRADIARDFPSVLPLLVGRQEGHPSCKKLGVGLLVVMI